MSQAIVQMLVKRTLKDAAQKNTNSTNPFEEEVPVFGRDGQPTGKVKKRKRPLPNDISEHDAGVLKKVRRRAYRLDMGLFNLFGLRFGWSSLVAIVPIIGDVLDALMALNVVRTCGQIEGGLPQGLRSRMVFNIILDFALGLVPFIGDIADAVFKANTRNCWLLEMYLVKQAEAKKKGTVTDEQGVSHRMPTKPINAYIQEAASRGGGFFSKFKRGDEEMALDDVPNTGHTQQHAAGSLRNNGHAQQQSGITSR